VFLPLKQGRCASAGGGADLRLLNRSRRNRHHAALDHGPTGRGLAALQRARGLANPGTIRGRPQYRTPRLAASRTVAAGIRHNMAVCRSKVPDRNRAVDAFDAKACAGLGWLPLARRSITMSAHRGRTWTGTPGPLGRDQAGRALMANFRRTAPLRSPRPPASGDPGAASGLP